MALLADRYELGETLGAGGMARVVAAFDRALHRNVAIKLIHDSLAGDPVSRERMLREARATAGLHHPNIVTVFDVDEFDGRAFIVMELVEGRRLTDRLGEEGSLPAQEAVAIADAVLAGLHVAHQRGLVHRDVKPSNILLTHIGGVKLADFGIAKAVADSASGLTGTGQVLGTARYLAPEQTKGEPATPTSDLYSLAVVLYQCLAGEAPFTAATPLAEALAHQRDPVPPLAQTAPHVPTAVARVVERALAKDPSARPSDATAMRRALQESVAGHDRTRVLQVPVVPPAQSISRRDHGRRAGVRGSRRRWLLGSMAAAVVLLGGLFVLNWIDQAGTANAGDATAGIVSDDVRTSPTNEPTEEPTQPAQPANLRQLISTLTSDQQAAGEKAPDLIKELRKIQEQRADKRARAAGKLIKKVADWVSDGKLTLTTGRDTTTVLRRVADR